MQDGVARPMGTVVAILADLVGGLGGSTPRPHPMIPRASIVLDADRNVDPRRVLACRQSVGLSLRCRR
jgi:hypothetical protein